MDSRVASFAVPGSRAAAASDPKQWIPESAQGATLRIAGGSELIDFASGGFRHSDPRLRARVEEQLRRLPLSGRVFFSRPLAELCRTLADLAPGDLEVSFPCNSGAEAIEGALKLAKGYAGSSRSHFVATHSAWHGATTAALGVCGIDAVREAMGVSPVHARFVPYGDVEALRAAVDRGTIAVLIEAIATSPGVQVPPRGYLSAVRDACRASGALLIVDELVTGVGVTGRLFAVDEEEVAPDILVLGGVLGGAMLPMALYIASRRVNDAVYRRSDPVLHGTTTGGNPAACVAALATLERVREERLVDGAAESGRTYGTSTALLSARLAGDS